MNNIVNNYCQSDNRQLDNHPLKFFARITATANVILAMVLLGACEKQNPAPTVAVTPSETTLPVDPAATTATEAVWQNAAATLQACITDTQQLRDQVKLFLNQPNAESLAQSRQAWHQAHNRILSFSVFFTLAEKNPGMFAELADHRYNLDAHPVQPGFIDYFDVYQHSGIVNDLAIALSTEALRQQHGITDHSDVSIGFHAMEYLLWGQDGQRPVEDFIALSSVSSEQSQQGLRVVDLPNNRRRVYLQLLAEILVDDCTRLSQFWQNPAQGLSINYHALQTASRLQLWQMALSDLVADLQVELWLADPESTDEITTEVTAEDSSIAGDESIPLSEGETHNAFAGQEAQALAAKFKGLSLVLFGTTFATTETEEKTPEAELARWIDPAPASTDTPTSTTKPPETTPPEAIPPLLALQEDIDQAITSLSETTTWPPADSLQETLSTLLASLQEALYSSSIDAK